MLLLLPFSPSASFIDTKTLFPPLPFLLIEKTLYVPQAQLGHTEGFHLFPWKPFHPGDEEHH